MTRPLRSVLQRRKMCLTLTQGLSWCGLNLSFKIYFTLFPPYALALFDNFSDPGMDIHIQDPTPQRPCPLSLTPCSCSFLDTELSFLTSLPKAHNPLKGMVPKKPACPFTNPSYYHLPGHNQMTDPPNTTDVISFPLNPPLTCMLGSPM